MHPTFAAIESAFRTTSGPMMAVPMLRITPPSVNLHIWSAKIRKSVPLVAPLAVGLKLACWSMMSVPMEACTQTGIPFR